MVDNAQGGSSFQLNVEASAAAIMGLSAALQLAVEFAVFPDRVKVDDKVEKSRLDFVTEALTQHVKNLFTEGLSEQDEANGTTAALAVIADNAAAIRRRT